MNPKNVIIVVCICEVLAIFAGILTVDAYFADLSFLLLHLGGL